MKVGGKVKSNLAFFIFVLPGALYMTMMILIPVGSNIVLSFKNVDMLNFLNENAQAMVGLETFKKVFSDSLMKDAIKNTFVFTFWCLFFQFPIGLGLAMLFSKSFPGSNTIRGINLIAWMIPMVAVAGIFKYMFNSDIGIVNKLLIDFRIIKEPVRWLAYGNTAMIAVVIANIWKGVPFNMILLATALTTLPSDVYEAAIIDGTNAIQRFFRITLPLLKPSIISVLTLGFIYTFKVFDLIYVMTNGGPGSSTEVLSSLAYRYSFVEYNFSKGAAVANVLFVILMVIGIFYIHLVRQDERERGV